MSLYCRNIQRELSQIFKFSLSPSLVPSPNTLEHTTDPIPRMSPPPNEAKQNKAWLCTCAKCGLPGKEVSRRTWYRHTPGGKQAKAPQLSEEQIERLINLPTPEFSGRRKKHLGGSKPTGRTHIFRRNPGSSSVRMRSIMIYAPQSSDAHKNMYLEHS
jgi:hypothetical protein